ncbi:hypothetical protein MT418_008178 [Batrachochytrium dendrobatidis]
MYPIWAHGSILDDVSGGTHLVKATENNLLELIITNGPQAHPKGGTALTPYRLPRRSMEV